MFLLKKQRDLIYLRGYNMTMYYKDDEHWSSLIPPLSPSGTDVTIYKAFLDPGTTLLLGHTKELLYIADVALDLNPIIADSKIVTGNWINNTVQYSNILCDGGLTLSKELCDAILDMASKHCANFISRVFDRRLAGMKYATYFPTEYDFAIKPSMVMILPDYTFFRWKFDVVQ